MTNVMLASWSVTSLLSVWTLFVLPAKGRFLG